MITPEEFELHRDRLQTLVSTVHRHTTLIVLASFAGYGLAGWLWFGDRTMAALLVATAAYLVFRAFRWLSFTLARLTLRGRAGFDASFALIERELGQAGAASVVTAIETRLRAAELEQKESHS